MLTLSITPRVGLNDEGDDVRHINIPYLYISRGELMALPSLTFLPVTSILEPHTRLLSTFFKPTRCPCLNSGCHVHAAKFEQAGFAPQAVVAAAIQCACSF
jgi:hypothetical protein